jgi:hypothetical protein
MTPTALLVVAAFGWDPLGTSQAGKEFGLDAVKQLDTVLERLIKINANEFDKLVKQVIEEFGQWRKKAVTGVISEVSTWRKGNVQVFQDELVPNMMSWLRNETQQWREQTSEPMVAAVRDLSSAADMSKLPLKEAAEVVQSALWEITREITLRPLARAPTMGTGAKVGRVATEGIRFGQGCKRAPPADNHPVRNTMSIPWQKKVLTWYRHGVDMVSTWCRHHVAMVQTRAEPPVKID